LKPFDQDGHFQLITAAGSLRRRAVRSAGVTLFSQGAGLFVQIISTFILARLLTPADFGIVTMVTTFSLLLVNFGLNGFTEAVIQYAEISHRLISNLFWVNLAMGLLLTLGFAASGSLMGRFYGNPHVAPAAAGISLTMLLTSASVLHGALLMRAMQFARVSAIDFLSRVVSVVVSVIFALMGWGYWALVLGAIAQPLAKCVAAWISCPWLPAFPSRVDGTGSIVKFSMHVYGRFTLNYFSRNTDNLLVGWRFNAVALGFYKKAYDLFALSAVIQSLTSVAVSALSKVRNDSDKYRRYILQAISVSAFLGMGLGADLTLVGRDLIRLLLGPGWETAGRIFVVFGPGIAIMPLYGIHSWVHLSIGTADRWLRWAWIEFLLTTSFFVLALHWGPSGVAASWSLTLWILVLPALWYAGKPVHFEIASVVRVTWRFVLSSLLASGATAAIIDRFTSAAVASSSVEALSRILNTSVLFSALYLLAVIALHRSWAPIAQVATILREFMPGSWDPAPSSADAENPSLVGVHDGPA
jgi:O-antigen/teichoic acid export membrane protein